MSKRQALIGGRLLRGCGSVSVLQACGLWMFGGKAYGVAAEEAMVATTKRDN